jgi:hypothetical protein
MLPLEVIGQAPSAPSQLTATAVSATQVNLSWTASTGTAPAGYYVLRNGVQVGSPTGTGWQTPTGNPTAYSDVDLTPGTVYIYTVEAYATGGTVSAPSNAVTTTTLPAVTIPSAPTIPPFYTCITNYYVSKNGSNSGNGSSASPWYSIADAIDFLSAQSGTLGGMCVNVGPGTYTESVYANALSGSADTPTGYFVLRSTTPHGAIIQLPPGSVDYTQGIYFNNASYIVVDGFVLAGNNAAPDIDGTGIYAAGSSKTQCTAHHIRIFNNIAYGWGGGGIGTQMEDYFDEEGNVVYNTSNTSIYGTSGIGAYEPVALDSGTWSTSTMDSASVQYHQIFRYNVAYNNAEVNIGANTHYDGNGISLDTLNPNGSDYNGYTQQTLIDTNLSFDNGGGGIVTGGYGASYMTVRNNTAFNNYIDAQNPSTGHGDIEIAGFVSSHDNILVNNIGVHNAYAEPANYALIDVGIGSAADENTDDKWDNNLSFNGTPGQASTSIANTTASITAANGNLLGADPLFANYLGGNFALQSTSPAINAGTTAYGVAAIDLAGNPRTNSGSVDIGAYEHTASAGTVTPTSALILKAPASASAGAPFSVQVLLLSNGNGIPTGNISILAAAGSSAAQQVAQVSATSALATAYAAQGTVATVSVTLSQAGNYALSASYAGDANFAAATSPNYTVDLSAPAFSIAITPSTLTVASGSTGTASITVTPQNGFNSAVSFACSGLPAGASCSFSPSTVTPSGAAATTTLAVSVSATASAELRNAGPRSHSPLFPVSGVVLASAWFWIGGKKRRSIQMLSLLAAGVLALTAISGCGSGGSGGGSPPPVSQTFTVTVTATSGSLQQTTTLTLTTN